MRLLLIFIIFILGGFYTFGDNNCCEQCCEYLGNCCKKEGEGKVKNENNVEKEEEEEKEVPEEFYLKKTKAADPEEIKKLVNPNWYIAKKETASFILYEKINGAGNQNLNKDDVIKVKKYKNGFNIDKNFITEKGNNTQKWALFEIIYKEEKEKGEGEKNDEENEKENKENETKYLYCSNIESGNSLGIFSNCQQYVSISVIACDTSGVTDMSDMFYGCSSLTKLNLSKFDTKKVTDMTFMFYDCSSLTELDLFNFNTEEVTDMCSMFSGCAYLQQLDLTNFNTGNVKDMDNMFYGCSSLTKLNLSKFDTKNVTNMLYMFYDCNSLQTVTFNKNLNNKIIQQLIELGLTEEVEEEENKIILKKKQLT